MLTMITSYGVKKNIYSGIVQREVLMDDLFIPEWRDRIWDQAVDKMISKEVSVKLSLPERRSIEHILKILLKSALLFCYS